MMECMTEVGGSVTPHVFSVIGTLFQMSVSCQQPITIISHRSDKKVWFRLLIKESLWGFKV